MANSLKIRVFLIGDVYVSEHVTWFWLHSTTASSTVSDEVAVKRLAARLFHAKEDQIEIALIKEGDLLDTPDIYRATLGGTS